MDVEQIKLVAVGHEAELLEYVGHLPREVLNGKHHPCPSCGGKDRFRFDTRKKFCICSQCFDKRNGDVFAAIQHFRGITFPEVLTEVAYRLGINNTPKVKLNGTPRPTPTNPSPENMDAEPCDDSADPLIRLAETKRCTVAALLAYGAESDPARMCVAFPMFDQTGKMCSTFTIWPDSDDPKLRKGMCRKDHPAGLFLLNPGDDPPRLPAQGESWVLCEGLKDASVLHSLGFLTAGLCGANLKTDLAPIFSGVDVTILLDNDVAGREAAPKVAAVLRGIAPDVRIATLPSAGDVRDNLHGDAGEAGIRAAIASAGQPAQPAFTRLLTSTELWALDLRQDYLVEKVLVRGQPGVIGGRSKTLKTSILVDLVMSLGSGTPFLNEFPVAEPVRVAFWSGESGAPTIRSKARAVAASRGLDPSSIDVLWSFDLPKLARDEDLVAIGDTIRDRGIQVAVVDPLYLSLLDAKSAGQAGNVFAMGAALEPLTRLTAETGCTILLAHHFRKGGSGDPDEPAALEELSQSGVAEWARQWCLLARRSPYAGTGRHELWMRAGGSAGHAGFYALDVDEGDPATYPTTGRKWDVEIRPVADARDEAQREVEDKKVQQLAARQADDRRKMLEALRRCQDGETLTALRGLAGIPNNRAADALRTLIGEGRAAMCEITKYRRSETGYRVIEI